MNNSPSDSEVVLTTVTNRVATITLNRPESRNALDSKLRAALPAALQEADDNDDVDVMILTGVDPAFCAGLDLKELGAGENRIDAGSGDEPRRPFPSLTKPLIGAINGVAITGGFEIALNCDFLIASERAAFADTHARVGVMPGWGLSVLLADIVGVRKAREISLTGNFVSADEALAIGLVNAVVDHAELLSTVEGLAADIVGNDQTGVRQMLATYAEVEQTTVAEGWVIEARNSRRFQKTVGFDPDEVERRRLGIVNRGRDQLN